MPASSHNPGVIEVVVFGRLFDAKVVAPLGENRFEVALIGETGRRIPGAHVIIERDTDYISNVPVPFAPLTAKGLVAAERSATNGLAQMEFGTIYQRRLGLSYRLEW